MTAILATFADFKLVKSRAVAQLVFEVPVEQADAALTALGGLPRADLERWAGIAPLKVPAEREQAATVASADAESAKGSPRSADRAIAEASLPARAEGGDKAGHKRAFNELPRSQQAALKIDDQNFRRWLATGDPHFRMYDADMADDAVKARLNIASKKELDTDPEAAKRWDALLNEYLDSRLPERR